MAPNQVLKLVLVYSQFKTGLPCSPHASAGKPIAGYVGTGIHAGGHFAGHHFETKPRRNALDPMTVRANSFSSHYIRLPKDRKSIRWLSARSTTRCVHSSWHSRKIYASPPVMVLEHICPDKISDYLACVHKLLIAGRLQTDSDTACCK